MKKGGKTVFLLLDLHGVNHSSVIISLTELCHSQALGGFGVIIAMMAQVFQNGSFYYERNYND